MFELLNETLFEKHMAEYLAGSKMYNQRTPKDFNIYNPQIEMFARFKMKSSFHKTKRII